MIDLKLEPVFSVLPLAIHLDLHRIRLRQFDADSGKADEMVMIAIGLRASVGTLLSSVFIRRTEYLLDALKNSTLSSAATMLTAHHLRFFSRCLQGSFSHGIFAIRTP